MAVIYMNGNTAITRVYAINEDVSRELSQLTRNLGGLALKEWLEDRGCQLDCADGPAVLKHYADGSTFEAHVRDGNLHRQDGPAIVRRGADGSTTDVSYYLDGKIVKEEDFRPHTPKAPNRPGPGPA
jgi:hypothetical protein